MIECADSEIELQKPPTLKEHVLHQLTEAIVSGQIKPGERLFEAHLAEKFRISRAPVREALHKLVEMGLAVSHPRRGIFVVKLEEEDLQKINSLRLILEAEALRLCRANLTPRANQALERIIGQMESSGPVPAVEAMQLDLEFHRTIWRTTGNEYLLNLLTSLTAPLFAQHVLMMPQEERAHKVVYSHRSLLEYVQGKLDRAAEDIMLDLLSVRWTQPARFSSLHGTDHRQRETAPPAEIKR
jgi:DNA-binding GntR family transcriptional regulator